VTAGISEGATARGDRTERARPPSRVAAEAGGTWRRRAAVGALGVACVLALIAWRLGVPAAGPSLAAAKAFAALHPAAAAAGFLLAYVALAALAVPAAWFMGLAAGALFGPWLGVPLAVASAAAAATVAMLLARHLFRDRVERRWPALRARLGAAAGADGAAALLAARLIPVLPFALVNVAAGLSPMPTGAFAAITAVGVLPLASIYGLAGAELGAVTSPADLLTARTTALLCLLAIAPLAARALTRRRRRDDA